jgi:uncharacterized protein (UPF0548 family)
MTLPLNALLCRMSRIATLMRSTMLLLCKPSPSQIRDFLARQSTLEVSYPEVGATAAAPPLGYAVDHTRIKLGEGEQPFTAGDAALRRWEHFRLGWVEAWPADTSIQKGAVVAVRAQVFGLWWLNACRIIYVVDETAPVRRFGFAYGTLPGHAESCEERFQVEWNRHDNSVWYDILAFSRPNQFLTRLGYPLVRGIQKSFARGSAAAMLGCVRSAVSDRASAP